MQFLSKSEYVIVARKGDKAWNLLASPVTLEQGTKLMRDLRREIAATDTLPIHEGVGYSLCRIIYEETGDHAGG